ncbi:MAG: hypothetical protein JWR74_1155 [Polaromonas sp.]|nr:hypothetical protein [Polaromonas sp.]
MVSSAATDESFSILDDDTKVIQLFCIRIPAFGCFFRSRNGRQNGLGPLILSSFDQAEFVGSFYFGPFKSGDEFGMGNGLIHKDFIIQSAIFRVLSR